MKVNSKLKIAILEAGIDQRTVAKETGIHEAHISMAIHGRYLLDPIQKEEIAKSLRRDKKELFQE